MHTNMYKKIKWKILFLYGFLKNKKRLFFYGFFTMKKETHFHDLKIHVWVILYDIHKTWDCEILRPIESLYWRSVRQNQWFSVYRWFCLTHRQFKYTHDGEEKATKTDGNYVQKEVRRIEEVKITLKRSRGVNPKRFKDFRSTRESFILKQKWHIRTTKKLATCHKNSLIGKELLGRLVCVEPYKRVLD